ncbi:MAG: hypothetical protein MUD12_09685 [Spirochaetes bacterium]|jgi:hypothetical protein|nr:hypothetical protein [Spirochaetota bacterium]
MRYAIHLHITDPAHYDFMFEKDGVLVTWRVSMDGLAKMLEGQTVTAERIKDHGIKYLEYEGPISCDRGRIELYDSGEYECNPASNPIKLRLTGTRLNGTITISDSKMSYTGISSSPLPLPRDLLR